MHIWKNTLVLFLISCGNPQPKSTIVEPSSQTKNSTEEPKQTAIKTGEFFFQEKFSGDIMKDCCPSEIYFKIQQSGQVTGEIIHWHLYDNVGLDGVGMENLPIKGTFDGKSLSLEVKVSEWGADFTKDPGWEPKATWSWKDQSITNPKNKTIYFEQTQDKSVRNMFLAK